MPLDSARADRVTAALLLAVGLALIWAGWSMDRLEMRRIHPASIPGLLPMLLGAALAVCAALLFRSARDPNAPEPAGSPRDLGYAAALCLIYALVLVGTVPFTLATGLFVAAFLVVFDRDRPVARRLLPAAIYGAVAATAISALFRHAFLVRLP